jgi:hypothetical protein
MEGDLFTSALKREDEGNLSVDIRAALAALCEAFAQPAEPLTWTDSYVAVPLRVAVELPARGPVGGVDIRPEEDIFLLLHRRLTLHQAPSGCNRTSLGTVENTMRMQWSAALNGL